MNAILEKAPPHDTSSAQAPGREHLRAVRPAAQSDLDARTRKHQETFFTVLRGIGPLFSDARVEEIMINGPQDIFFEVGGVMRKYTEATLDRASIDAAISLAATLSNTSVTPVRREGQRGSPLVYAQVGNLRVAAAIPPVAHYSPCLSIRVHRRQKRTLDDYEKDDSFAYLSAPQAKQLAAPSQSPGPAQVAEYFRQLMQQGASVLVSGTPSGGKSTFMDMLVSLLPQNKRTLVLEDTHEIDPAVPNRVVLIANEEAEVTTRDLVKFANRMRPDVIVVGELRDRAAADFLTAANSGPQALASIHSDSALDALRKLESLAMQANEGMPHDAIRQQIASTINVVVHMARVGAIRAPVQALRVAGYRDGHYVTEDIFRKAQAPSQCSAS